MGDHTKLRAFEMADEVAVLLYHVTAGFPKEERYGLTSRMRRAAVSVRILWKGVRVTAKRIIFDSSIWPSGH